jgi:NAD(P)-dependent dehydrogenase (short-subunit alcohol dehydrogenase family)
VNCNIFPCDLSLPTAAKTIAGYLRDENIEIDILVLNASVQFRRNWNEVGDEEYETQMNTNFRSSLALITALYPPMKEKGWGRILTLGSVQQIRPHQQMIVYAASKTAQASLVKSLAPQFGKHGVTINNLAPGTILTGRNDAVLSDPEYRARVASTIPLGYIGRPSDCAATALLLCSDAGRYITGQDVFVDGGMGLAF